MGQLQTLANGWYVGTKTTTSDRIFRKIDSNMTFSLDVHRNSGPYLNSVQDSLVVQPHLTTNETQGAQVHAESSG